MLSSMITAWYKRLLRCSSAPTIRSCTCSLRIIAAPRKPGTMPPYHTIVRGLCHDSIPVLLPVGGLGTPVAVCHAALCLAQPMRDGPGNASQAHRAAASTLQGAQAICRPHPPALLRGLCTGNRAAPAGSLPPATPHGPHARPTAPGRHLAAFLPASGLCVSGLGGTGQSPCQWPSQRWTVAPVALHRL